MRWKNDPSGIDEQETWKERLWSERGMFELVIFKRDTFRKPRQNEDQRD